MSIYVTMHPNPMFPSDPPNEFKCETKVCNVDGKPTGYLDIIFGDGENRQVFTLTDPTIEMLTKLSTAVTDLIDELAERGAGRRDAEPRASSLADGSEVDEKRD